MPPSVAPETICGRCGHAVYLHGRRGFGQCRHGWEKPLVLAVRALKAAVAANLHDDERKALLERAMEPRPRCDCARFLKRPPKAKTA